MSSDSPIPNNAASSEETASTEPFSSPTDAASTEPGTSENAGDASVAAVAPVESDDSPPANTDAPGNVTDSGESATAQPDSEEVSTADRNDANPASEPSVESSGGPKLAPRVDESARAIPTHGNAAPGPDGKPDPNSPRTPPAEPVEIPKSEDLDAALEAEIAAAMNADTATSNEPVVTIADESASAESETPAETAPVTEENIETGTRLKGTVQTVDAENIFVDLGLRSPGLLPARQFPEDKRPSIGDVIDIVVDKVDEGEGLILVNAPRGRRKVGGNWDAVSVGQIVDCMVTKSNKGGLEVSISNLRGFLPKGQIDLGFIEDIEPFVGQKMTVQVIEVNPRKRNLVVSRRALLQAERMEASKQIWETLEVGEQREGRVKTLKEYGAFVDIGGLDGFLHIGEISWSRINHPKEVLKEGQTIDVKVLSIDRDRERIGLGMRQLTQNPWSAAVEKYASGTTVSGQVTKTTDFGAFVELEPGLEGLVHISELDYRRVARVTEILNIGDRVELQVLEIDPSRKRISLSLKATRPKPESAPKPKDEDLAPSSGEEYRRKRKGPLKGGYGGDSSGGLFGNPSDFNE